MRDAIRYNRTDTALVRVVVPVAANDEAAAQEEAIAFVRSFFTPLRQYLPADTVLYLPLGAQVPGQPSRTVRSAEDVLGWLKQLGFARLQIGGSRSLGRGIVHLRWYEQGNGS